MRILLLVNNWVGWQIAEWLTARGEAIVGLVTHPPHQRKFGDEILRSVNTADMAVFDGSQLRQPQVLEAIRRLRPDIGLSLYFGHILRPELLSLFPSGAVNLHPAYLPYNRGAHPNIWSIVEGTPAGVTLHYMNDGVDLGDIIAQRQVPVEPIDTGKTLYHKLEAVSVAMFKETWPLILAGSAPRQSQTIGSGTTHRVRELEELDHIDLNRRYTARELIDILRARTFPPYTGAYFQVGGRKVYLRLDLQYEDGTRKASNDERI